MNVLPIIARLKDELVPSVLASVDECDDINDAIKQLRNNKPAAFVMFTGETAGLDRNLTGVTSQAVQYRFLVALGIQGAGNANMAKGSRMEAVRDAVKDKLIGWMPEGCAAEVIYLRTTTLLKNLDAHLLFLGVEFQTAYYERKVHS